MVREHGILFAAPMVRAILEGQKTMTRRVVKPQPDARLYSVNGGPEWTYPDPHDPDVPDWGRVVRCPYGVAGDRLWVRETWATVKTLDHLAPSKVWQYDRPPSLYYAEWTGAARNSEWRGKWRPSIHMPRWASRTTLENASVRVERLQDITEEDAKAEGMASWAAASCSRLPEDELYARAYFELAWDAINGKRHPWASSPWVWVVEFKLCT